MRHVLRCHWQLHKKSHLSLLWFLLGGYLLGQIAMALVAIFSTADEPWFPAGSMFALLSMVMSMIYDGYAANEQLQLALSMGRRRLPQFLTTLLFSLLRLCIGLLLVWLLALLDKQIGLRFYPGREITISPLVFFSFPLPFLYLCGCLILTTLITGILARFGTRGGSILYFAFLFSFLVVSNVIDRLEHTHQEAVAGFFRGIGGAVMNHPMPALLVLGALTGVILWLIWRMIRRSVVRFC